jgi:outer membrane usher protein
LLGALLALPPALRAQTQPEPEAVILTVRSNGIERGEFTLLRTAGNDFWIAADDLRKLAIEPRADARRELGGQTWYSARQLGATSVSFDEAQLKLAIDFRAELLAGSRIDLSSRPAPLPTGDGVNSLVLSYRLSVENQQQGRTNASAATDLNVRISGLLLRQEMRMDTAPERRGLARGASQVIWDDRRNARRYTAGDVVSSAGPYGNTITGAGVSVTKVYELAPDLVHQPTANFRASTALPADVEVQVDGATLYRGHVAPGPIVLDNLLLSGGTRTVRMIVTDSAGRQQIIEQPFLFTDSVLAKGFHEYNYFAGKRSELTPDTSFQYRENAWQAFHRYGATDDLTVGAGGEGSADFYNVGAGITLRNDRAGLLGVDLLRHSDTTTGKHASGWSARYTYQSPVGTLLLARRGFGQDYHSFPTSTTTTTLLDAFPRGETRVGVSTSWWRLNLSADWVRTVTAKEAQIHRFLRLSTTLPGNVSLFAEYQTTRIDSTRGWGLNVFLRKEFESNRWVSSTFTSQPGARSVELQAGQQVPAGEGFGYRVGTSLGSVEGGTSERSAFLAGDLNLRPASLSLYAESPLRSGGSSYVLGQVTGAIVALDGYWGATRQVNDGFALVRLGVPQKGVEILLNNQAQGRTDAEGRLFIPQVGSFSRQDVGINDKELPMEYTLPEKKKTIVPTYRGGTVVNFGLRKVNAVAGTAWQVQGGQRAPIGARSWGLSGPSGRVAIDTGSNGEFYLDDAPAGVYTGTVDIGDRTYNCRMVIPVFPEPVLELKEGMTCE